MKTLRWGIVGTGFISHTVIDAIAGSEGSTAVVVTGITLIDMLKAIDREIVIGEVRLLEKSGGRSGDWARPTP